MPTAIAFIIIFAVFIFIEHFWRKRLQGEGEVKISDTPGRKIYNWGRGIILVLALTSLTYVVFYMDTQAMKWFFIAYLSILHGFQALLEWRYLKDSKEYIATLTALAVGVIFIFNIEAILSL